jgi:RNA polymerase sigma-70 factor (ECF subfamily)
MGHARKGHAHADHRSKSSSVLVEAAQHGDRSAISALLVACQPDIRRYARMTCAADNVDDAVQDVLWLLYRRIGTLREIASFSTWLFEIVRRECMRLAKRAMGVKHPLEDIENDPTFAHRPTIDLRLDLVSAIQSLPDHYRVVLLYRDIEELTIDEISDLIGITREAVKARLHRARAMIREYLAA